MAKKNKAKKEPKKKAQKGGGGSGETPEEVQASSSSQVQSPSLGPEKGPAFIETEEAISVLPDDSTEKVPETAIIDLDAAQSLPAEESSDMIQQEDGPEETEPVPTTTEDADPAPETTPQVTDEVVDDAEWEKDVDELEKLLQEINAPQEPTADATGKDAAEEKAAPEKDVPEEEPVYLAQEEKEDEPEVAAEALEQEAPAHVDEDDNNKNDDAQGKPSDDSQPDEPAEVPVETAAEEELVEAQRDLPEADHTEEDPAEEHIPVETEEPDTRSVVSGKMSRYPTHPPAPMPLPSPVPSEPRSIHSPVPDHPLSRHGSPLTYHVSPPYRYATPHIHPYGPHMMGMAGPPPPPIPPMHPGSVAPSSASFATAYHSPIMDHAPMPPPYGYPRRPSGLSNGGFYNGKMDRTQSGGSGHSHSHHHRTEKANGGPPDEKNHEHHHLMGRIEKVMPDISRLMDSFKDTQGKLQAREAESRQLQSQHEQAIMHKDFYIEALQGQMRKAATETAEEYTKLKNVISELRLELGNQQEKVKDLEECLALSRKEKEELESVKTGIETEIQGLQKKIEELQLEHERAVEESKEHERTELSLQKEELTNLFEEIRAEDENAANDRYNEREKELIDEKEALKSAWEEEKIQLEEAQAALKTELESAQNDLQESREDAVAKTGILEAKEKELESKKTELESRLEELHEAQGELTSTKTKLENNQVELESTQAELNSTLEELTAKQLELEKGHKEFQENHANHTAEREKLTAFHAAQVEALHGTHSTQLGDLRNTHETTLKEAEDRCKALIAQLEEKEKAWAAEKSELEKQLTEKTDELTGLEREREALERGDIAREKHLQSAVDEMRRTIDNMENDREKLRKTLQSLGEATDLKTSKGDQFFMESFGQLRKLIVELSKEHFSYLPIDPPKDILEKIPPKMPSFLDNTPAAQELRAAYIQHVVSKTLTYRVFQPFLFTLGRRYDKADTFFQVLSMDIRRKSVRREAFWRQQTLKAAYTTSDAKQSINVVAAVIVDEIVDHIKHFADPKQLDALLNGVRRIVKIAAETWRHARVERELVLATMPAPESEGVSNEEWEEYTCGRRAGGPASGTTTSPTHCVLLRVFPRIYREAAHEDFADDKEKFNACVYFPGTIMYSDSPSVIARREELGRKSPLGNGVNGEK